MYKIVQKPIPKYYQTNDMKGVIFHVDLGTAEGTYSHLKHTATASYHVYFPREQAYENEIWVFVSRSKGAWHASAKGADPTDRALEVFGTKDFNKQSAGWCYGGRPLDSKGDITNDYKKAIDGQLATESQVDRAVWYLKQLKMDELPLFAHREITPHKPECVLDFVERVKEKLKENTQYIHTCPKPTMEPFTTSQLINEVIRRFGKG